MFDFQVVNVKGCEAPLETPEFGPHIVSRDEVKEIYSGFADFVALLHDAGHRHRGEPAFEERCVFLSDRLIDRTRRVLQVSPEAMPPPGGPGLSGDSNTTQSPCTYAQSFMS